MSSTHMGYRMDTGRLQDSIEKAMEKPGITLIKTSSTDYQQANITILDSLVNIHSLSGIYVTVNKPYTTITNLLNEKNIDPSRIFFIDAISKDRDTEIDEQDNVMFVESPQNLTDISIVLTEAVETMPDTEKFVFFDSMSILTIYNDNKTVTKFAHYLTGKMRKWNVAGVIISVEDEMNDELISHLTQFCDNVIEV